MWKEIETKWNNFISIDFVSHYTGTLKILKYIIKWTCELLNDRSQKDPLLYDPYMLQSVGLTWHLFILWAHTGVSGGRISVFSVSLSCIDPIPELRLSASSITVSTVTDREEFIIPIPILVLIDK